MKIQNKAFLTACISLITTESYGILVTLDPATQWGPANTVISVTSNQFTAVDVQGSGVDIRFTITGDSLRTGFPRTFSQGGSTVIQGSAEAAASPSTASSIDTVGAPTIYATRGYILEFFDTGTTNAYTVSNLSLEIGDIDESELYGGFAASAGGAATAFTFSSLPTHISAVNNGTDPEFLQSDATSIDNSSTGGNVIVNFSQNVDTFQFTAEKGENRNIGVVMNAISFDTVAVPETSSFSTLAGIVALSATLTRRKNRKNQNQNQ